MSDPMFTYVQNFFNRGQCCELTARAFSELHTDFRTTEVKHREGYKLMEDVEPATKLREHLAIRTNRPIDHIEPVEIVRYSPGAEYPLHYDGWWRTHTALVYLNHDYTGGHTVFPNIPAGEVQPREGAILLWENARDRTNIQQHSYRVDKLLKRTKWIAVTWAWETKCDTSILSGTTPRT